MIYDSGFCDSCINETCKGCPVYEQAVEDDNDEEQDEYRDQIDWDYKAHENPY